MERGNSGFFAFQRDSKNPKGRYGGLIAVSSCITTYYISIFIETVFRCVFFFDLDFPAELKGGLDNEKFGH